MKLMEGMISGPGGQVLGDESVCEMMETGLSMCCQARLSELLRRSAEIAMVSMCQVIFRRLKTLEIESPEELDAMDEELEGKDEQDGLRMDPTANGEGDSAQHKVEALQQRNAELAAELEATREALQLTLRARPPADRLPVLRPPDPAQSMVVWRRGS